MHKLRVESAKLLGTSFKGSGRSRMHEDDLGIFFACWLLHVFENLSVR